ncbi:MAG TPA: phosphatidylserine decarboxylase [Geobacteraceae bacterium]|nr:phosphatidylserine decarboxylase [Geobacteraceae bacterium]
MRQEHKYINRGNGAVCSEEFFADRAVSFIYSTVREKAPCLFKALTGQRVTQFLGFVNYDLALNSRMSGAGAFVKKFGIDESECLLPFGEMDTPRKIFERRIAYWRCRPMNEDPAVVVSPADSKMFIGSLDGTSMLFLKGKFFDFAELVGRDRTDLHGRLDGADFAVFRLTPEKYHHNHTPVSGVVTDVYWVDGSCHSCNPSASIAIATPLSKNRRVVTVIDTDVKGGSNVGTVVMVEVVALMIGDIVQCYSENRYDDPVPVAPGLFVMKGSPKSLFRPGSSSVVLFFEKGKMAFSGDLLKNQLRGDIDNRFAAWLEKPLVETEVRVRSTIGARRCNGR